MPEQMILDETIVAASFWLATDESEPFQISPTTAVPLEPWLAHLERGLSPSDLGVILEGDSNLEALKQHHADIPLIALHLPKFTDGRIYSHARRLRTLWGYQGTLLVFGDVLRDQLLYLKRCGINAFYMREDQDLKASLAAFSLYTEHYQYSER